MTIDLITTDLRNDYDATTKLPDCVLYRKGRVVQVWWSAHSKPETWNCRTAKQAIEEYYDMVERWSEPIS